MKVIRGVLFDLDGTLLDSAPDLVGSLNWLRGENGLQPLPVSQMSEYASRGAVGLLTAGMPATDEQTFESWRLSFLDHYAQNSFVHSELYDGIPELLDFLDESAIPWGVVTNKIESLTYPIIDMAELRHRISCVVCGDTLSQSKPHPAPVRLACGIINLDPAEVVFVGDDVRDIEAGVAAGTQTAAVHYGYGSAELTQSPDPADFQLHHPGELGSLIRRQQQFAGERLL